MNVKWEKNQNKERCDAQMIRLKCSLIQAMNNLYTQILLMLQTASRGAFCIEVYLIHEVNNMWRDVKVTAKLHFKSTELP